MMWRQAVEQDKVKKKEKVLEKEEALEMDADSLKEEGPEKENGKEGTKEETTENDEVDTEHRIWNWKHMIVDLVWNILSISSRVVALALFASYQLYWF